jgi:hypothetical protein
MTRKILRSGWVKTKNAGLQHCYWFRSPERTQMGFVAHSRRVNEVSNASWQDPPACPAFIACCICAKFCGYLRRSEVCCTFKVSEVLAFLSSGKSSAERQCTSIPHCVFLSPESLHPLSFTQIRGFLQSLRGQSNP